MVYIEAMTKQIPILYSSAQLAGVLDLDDKDVAAEYGTDFHVSGGIHFFLMPSKPAVGDQQPILRSVNDTSDAALRAAIQSGSNEFGALVAQLVAQ